jgi:hypothetical protein
MFYQILADVLVVAHLGFIAFVVFGGLLAFRWSSVPLAHVPAALWGGYVEFSGRLCPLTPLENWLRGLGGSAGYGESFIERYLLPIIYPAELTAEIQLVLGFVVVGVNVVIYGCLFLRSLKRRQH